MGYTFRSVSRSRPRRRYLINVKKKIKEVTKVPGIFDERGLRGDLKTGSINIGGSKRGRTKGSVTTSVFLVNIVEKTVDL